MKFAITVLCLVAASVALSIDKRSVTRDAAETCSASVCSGGSCYCSSVNSPIDVSETPQLVTLVYTDAVTDAIYTTYLQPLFEGRTNPDGAQIGATIYVPHEYTDYERVNNLYNLGLEIAVHTISRNSLTSYWQEASLDTLVQEFYGQRQIISRFANIPIEDVVGAKMPNLEMAGNTLFEAYASSGIEYDNSWVARSTNKYFPYTLDYLSTQPCDVGTCPEDSFPGTWIVPLVDFVSSSGLECNSLQGCSVSGTADEVQEWLQEQFDRVYNDNKAPITIVINSGWFSTSEDNLAGLTAFLDELANQDDVFLVSHSQVIEWMKNPVSASSFATDVYDRSESCLATTCTLMKEEEYRYMKSCVSCPSSYPWLGNPLGTA